MSVFLKDFIARIVHRSISEEIYRSRELKQNALRENSGRQRLRQHIAEMTKFLNDQSGDLQEYDEQLVRRLIDKITTLDDMLTIEFKSCVKVDIEI